MLHRPALAALVLSLSACAGVPARQGGAGDLPPTARRTGLEVRVYPAGVIVDSQTLWPTGDRDAWHFEVGANITDRRDFGEQDDEEGSGAGVGFGWRRYEDEARMGLFWGARADLWSLEIDWEDDDGPEGTTDVIVLQPTVEVGRAWGMGGPWVFEASLALGAEINVDTDGEDVGEGAILLGGLGVSAGF